METYTGSLLIEEFEIEHDIYTYALDIDVKVKENLLEDFTIERARRFWEDDKYDLQEEELDVNIEEKFLVSLIDKEFIQLGLTIADAIYDRE